MFLSKKFKKIREICNSAGVSYCDVLCSKENDEIFRYTYGANVTGEEYLQDVFLQ